MPKKIPKSELEQDIRRVTDIVGEPLTQGEYATEGEYTVRTIKNRYGGWNEMKNALSLEKSVQTTNEKHSVTLKNEVIDVLEDSAPEHMSIDKFADEIIRAYLNTGYRGTRLSPRIEESIQILHKEYGLHEQEIMHAFDVSSNAVKRCIGENHET